MLVAISDLHVEVPENRRLVDGLRPRTERDWLLVVGDVGEVVSDIEWALANLAAKFEQVVWVPGNHELWTRPDDPVQLRGVPRYLHLVNYCRKLGILTPEDPYIAWPDTEQPTYIAPLFTLYDYTFHGGLGESKRDRLASAERAGVVCSDEILLHPEPFPSIEEWCRSRVEMTHRRLTTEIGAGSRSILVSHFPLLRELTVPLMFPEFALWCGTEQTAQWHREFNAVAVVYGHLHIPRTTVIDGVRFEEVSVGYPREWMRRGATPAVRQILPGPDA
jgi:3',5'-cyclic AMP phosphodiesterase CpdA